MPLMHRKPKRPRDSNQLAKLIVDMSTGDAPRDPEPQNSVAAESGRKGGKIGGTRRMHSLTLEERKALAHKAARARWAKADRKD